MAKNEAVSKGLVNRVSRPFLENLRNGAQSFASF